MRDIATGDKIIKHEAMSWPLVPMHRHRPWPTHQQNMSIPSPIHAPPTHIDHYLDVGMVCSDAHLRLEGTDDLGSHFGLAHANMVLAEEELPVEVAGLDRVQIDL